MIDLHDFYSLFDEAKRCLNFGIKIPLEIKHQDFSFKRIINRQNQIKRIENIQDYLEYQPNIKLYSVCRSQIVTIERIRVFSEYVQVILDSGYIVDYVFSSREKAESYLYLS